MIPTLLGEGHQVELQLLDLVLLVRLGALGGTSALKGARYGQRAPNSVLFVYVLYSDEATR